MMFPTEPGSIQGEWMVSFSSAKQITCFKALKISFLQLFVEATNILTIDCIDHWGGNKKQNKVEEEKKFEFHH